MLPQLAHLPFAAIDDGLFHFHARFAPLANAVGKDGGHRALVLLTEREGLCGIEFPLPQMLDEPLDKRAGNDPAATQHDEPFDAEPNRHHRGKHKRSDEVPSQRFDHFAGGGRNSRAPGCRRAPVIGCRV